MPFGPLRRGRWLSADPIGEVGGMNLYGYVKNDPMGNVDLLGLANVSICTNRGKTFQKTNPSMNDVRMFLSTLGLNEMIANMEINGHGYNQGIAINDTTNDGFDVEVNVTASGKSTYTAIWTDTSLPMAPDFYGHTNKDTNISLDGCNTANDRPKFMGNLNNLAKIVSQALTGAKVAGLRGPGWLGIPGGNANHVTGISRIYQDGRRF